MSTQLEKMWINKRRKTMKYLKSLESPQIVHFNGIVKYKPCTETPITQVESWKLFDMLCFITDFVFALTLEGPETCFENLSDSHQVAAKVDDLQ